MFDVVVNEPGTIFPVQSNIVQAGLHQAFQENSQSEISSLKLGVTNAPTVSQTQHKKSVDVRLTDTNASQVSI